MNSSEKHKLARELASSQELEQEVAQDMAVFRDDVEHMREATRRNSGVPPVELPTMETTVVPTHQFMEVAPVAARVPQQKGHRLAITACDGSTFEIEVFNYVPAEE